MNETNEISNKGEEENKEEKETRGQTEPTVQKGSKSYRNKLTTTTEGYYIQ